MRHVIQALALTFLMVFTIGFAFGQKKAKSFKREKIIALPAEKIWAVVGEDYGAIAYSHPRIVYSEYINGSLKAAEGAERLCNFNDKGTQYLKEKMVNYNPEEMTFINKVYQAGRFPVDPDYTQALYKVEDLGDGRARLTFDMQYRTKPAFMGGLMKGQFKKLIDQYFIAIEHHVRTGEKVTRDNFKSIKKQYVM